MSHPKLVAINGAGRVGRLALRAYFEQREKFKNLSLCAINDPHDLNTLAHLLTYDSVHGRFHLPVEVNNNKLYVAGECVPTFACRDPAELPWKDHGVDVVLECTGRFKSYDLASKHLLSGARQVVLSCPGGKGVADTVVLGANEHVLAQVSSVYSIGSCTTNALAPVLAVVDRAYGIEDGSMLTVHAYTNDQALVDNHHSDLRRARAAACSIIPTKTGAAKAVAAVLPQLKDKLMGYALRVPTANVSVVDCNVRLTRSVTLAQVKTLFTEAVRADAFGVLALSDVPLVSCDFNHHTASAIVDLTLLEVVGNTLRLVIWYDNEWGYANRLWDVVALQHTMQLEEETRLSENQAHVTTS